MLRVWVRSAVFGGHIRYSLSLALKLLSAENENYQITRSLILVPTRELSEQISLHLKCLLAYCDKEVIVLNAASGNTSQLQRCALHKT